MKIIHNKCKYCGALLSETNSVFIHINRYDDSGRNSKQIWMCCNCWDNTNIYVPDKALEHDDPLRNEKLRINYTPNKEN